MVTKKFTFILFVSSLIACVGFSEKRQPSPNIIFFLVDDLGWQDTSVPFADFTTANNKYMQTPHMERLAKEAMVFTDAYAASPVCSPTRSSIMTGKNPARTRITNWIPGEGDYGAKKQRFKVPYWRIDGLNPTTDRMLPQIVKENGYTTVFVGKAHYGRKGTIGAEPLNLGYDINIAGDHKGHPGSYYVPYGKTGSNSHVPGLDEFYKDSLYLTDALTLKAIRLIDSLAKTKAPFFIMMSHYGVHTPIMGKKPLQKKYETESKTKREAAYASMVESIDQSLGTIMDKLQELDIAKNTIIIFVSDNGGLVTQRGPTTCYPLRLGKGTSYEGGIRVPMMVKWPEVTSPGRCNEPITTDDLLPTILHMIKADSASTKISDLDGQNLEGLLRKGGTFHREKPLIWHYPHYWANPKARQKYPGIRPFSAIRIGNWKFIYSYDDQKAELYNLKDDIGERNNLIKEHPKKARELCTELTKRLKEMKAQTPVDRKNNTSVPFPTL